MLTQGDQSMPWFGRITGALQKSCLRRGFTPSQAPVTGPNGTHPEQFAAFAAQFIHSSAEQA
jgi:hypothetical protein